jgi:hypothetical protein
VTFSAWVSVYVYEAIVVCSSNEHLVLTLSDRVNVRTICSRAENTINSPAKLGGMVSPDCVHSCRSTSRILLSSISIEEKEFISSTYCSDGVVV